MVDLAASRSSKKVQTKLRVEVRVEVTDTNKQDAQRSTAGVVRLGVSHYR